jgi:tetratricopeptide (TPR) repeat protein
VLDEPTLQRALKQLVHAELLFQRGQPPESTYIFKHALIQDAAYQSLLKSIRQQHHRRIAHALIDSFSDFVRTQPEVVAYHLGEAAENDAAIGYWQEAARLAMQRSAHPESVAHLLRALDLVPGLVSPARENHEVEIRLALGFAYIPISGWAAPESVPAFHRALELCGDTGNPGKRFRALFGLAVIYTVRGDHPTALRFGDQALEIAQQTKDPDLLPYAHHVAGWSLVWLGRFQEAIQHLQEAIAHCDPARSATQRAFYGFDIKAVALRWLSYALLAAGHLDRARQLALGMLDWAEKIADPHTFVAVNDHYCWMHNDLRAWDGTVRTSEEQVKLCEAEGRGFAFFASAARMARGGALIHLGQIADGMELIRTHLAEFDIFGAQSSRPRSFANLALGSAKLGQQEEALEHIAKAIALCEKQEERYWESGIYRMQGEVYLLQDPPREDRAEASFQHAVQIARRQQAKLFELQAALQLARLWKHQGRHQQARDVLAPVYDWFTEGFDTTDMKEAQALLEELRG